MIELEMIRDKIVHCIGLMDALHVLLWSLPVPAKHKKEFNSVLALADCLQVELNSAYELVINEV